MTETKEPEHPYPHGWLHKWWDETEEIGHWSNSPVYKGVNLEAVQTSHVVSDEYPWYCVATYFFVFKDGTSYYEFAMPSSRLGILDEFVRRHTIIRVDVNYFGEAKFKQPDETRIFTLQPLFASVRLPVRGDRAFEGESIIEVVGRSTEITPKVTDD